MVFWCLPFGADVANVGVCVANAGVGVANVCAANVGVGVLVLVSVFITWLI